MAGREVNRADLAASFQNAVVEVLVDHTVRAAEEYGIRKVAIAMYEGEINMVIHAKGGEITVEITPAQIKMILADVGPGIPDVEQAMKAGYSTAPDEVRSLGFGAGMGLPNMKKYTDSMTIDTTVGVGTTITMTVEL